MSWSGVGVVPEPGTPCSIIIRRHINGFDNIHGDIGGGTERRHTPYPCVPLVPIKWVRVPAPEPEPCVCVAAIYIQSQSVGTYANMANEKSLRESLLAASPFLIKVVEIVSAVYYNNIVLHEYRTAYPYTLGTS